MLQGHVAPSGSSWPWSRAGGTEWPCAPGSAVKDSVSPHLPGFLHLVWSRERCPFCRAEMCFLPLLLCAEQQCCRAVLSPSPRPSLVPFHHHEGTEGSEPAGRTAAQCWVLSQSQRAQRSPWGRAPHLCAVGSLLAAGVSGGTWCLKGILYKAAVPLVSQSPPGGRSLVYIDSCTVSQPLPPTSARTVSVSLAQTDSTRVQLVFTLCSVALDGVCVCVCVRVSHPLPKSSHVQTPPPPPSRPHPGGDPRQKGTYEALG